MGASRISKAIVIGSRFGPYEIRSLLGKGGMGEVYLAYDTRYARNIALKVLFAEASEDEDRLRRFRLEARSIIQVNHPNIITIFEFGEIESIQYIATEFIRGETLRQRITRDAMMLSEVLDITIQVATALDAAHQAHILHRDVKPENIMIRPDKIVKMLDFGLAKFADKPSETLPGMIMGTVAYMSPEQTLGEVVDCRTDIFSLGVMLYEMISGCVPFAGSNFQAIFAAILSKRPQPLADFSPDVPAEMQKIVDRALEKKREARYQTVGEMLSDLKRLKRRVDRDEPILLRSAVPIPKPPTSRITELVGRTTSIFKRHKKASMFFALTSVLIAFVLFKALTSSTPLDPNMMAVLPFVSDSVGDKDTDEVCQKITEETIKTLSELKKNKVISFGTMPYNRVEDNNDPENYRAVGKKLGVLHVLVGRVFKTSSGYRITTDLYNVEKQTPIKEEKTSSYSRADLELVTQWVSKFVCLNFPSPVNEDTEKRNKRLEVDFLYKQGRSQYGKRTAQGMEDAIKTFEQIIINDSTYAEAYTGKADCYILLAVYGAREPSEVFPQAKLAAEQALAIDSNLAEVHTSLAFIKFFWDRDWQATQKEFERALDLNPDSAQALQWYAVYLSAMGKFNDALEQVNKAIMLSNFSLIIKSQLAFVYYFQRQYPQAIVEATKTIEKDQNFFVGHRYLGWAYEQTPQYDQAVAEFESAKKLANNSSLTMAELAHAYAISGNRSAAQNLLDQLIATKNSKQSYVSAYNIALVYAGLGDKDKAITWLERAAKEKADFIVFLNVDPRLDSLRSEKPFIKLLQSLNFPPS